MAVVPPATRPIIICGMARSGTSLVGQLIKTSAEVRIFPEMAPHNTPSMFDLLAEVRHVLTEQTWRDFTEEDIDARVVELLRRVWGAGRDSGKGDDVGQPRFGHKQPHAEEFASRFAEVLGRYRPQWVYSIRDPVAIYRSSMHMFGVDSLDPVAFTTRFRKSVRTAARLAAAGDLFTVDVDRATGDPEHRTAVCGELFAFLGLVADRHTTSFLERWPPTNRFRGDVAAGSAAEFESRVKAFSSGAAFDELVEEIEALR